MSGYEDTPYQHLTGDASVVSAQAQKIKSVAEAIAKAVVTLHKVRDLEGMAGEAVTKLSGTAGDVADDISKAHARYSAAGEALTSYASELKTAQASAATAVTHIDDLAPQLAKANDSVQLAQDKTWFPPLVGGTTAPSASQQQDLKDDLTKAQHHADAVNTELKPWHTQWINAATDKTTAAGTAAGKIESFTGDNADGLNNHWYDGITSFVSKAWDGAKDFLKGKLFGQLLTILDDVLTVLSVVAVVLAFIPGVDVVDLGLGPLIAVLAGVSTVAHVLRDGAQGNWKMAIFDGAVGALSIFGGGAMSALAKAGVEDGAHITEAVAESGEVKTAVGDVADKVADSNEVKTAVSDVADEGDAAETRVDRVKKAILKAAERSGKAKNSEKTGFWADTTNDLMRGKYGFVSVTKLRGAADALGFGGKEIEGALADADHPMRGLKVSLLGSASIAARGIELSKGTVELVQENIESFAGGGGEGGE